MNKQIDSKLNLLYTLLIDDYSILKEEIIFLIGHPEGIVNTNKFSTLLSKLAVPTFINPLLHQISLANKNDLWLRDFLYAAGKLLEQCSPDESFEIPDTLFEKLKDWLLNNQNELAWNTAILLKHYESDETEEIQLKKLEQDDFFLTHYECLLGLLNYNRTKHLKLVQQIAMDQSRNKDLRQLCEKLLIDL